jgi:hypothetical protein
MAENKLTKLLEQLRDELSNTQALDEKGRDLLRALDSDIQKLLQHSDGGNDNELSLDRLQEAIQHFEASHPALTSALSGVVNVLSNAGI